MFLKGRVPALPEGAAVLLWHPEKAESPLQAHFLAARQAALIQNTPVASERRTPVQLGIAGGKTELLHFMLSSYPFKAIIQFI